MISDKFKDMLERNGVASVCVWGGGVSWGARDPPFGDFLFF